MAHDKSLFGQDAGYYEYVPGLWLPGKAVPNSTFGSFTRRAVDELLKIDLDDSDILFATYPKTGQTWTQTIIHSMLSARNLEKGEDLNIEKLWDLFMEVEDIEGKTGADKFHITPPPRLLKTHIPYKVLKPLLDRHPNVKIIQTIRNPKDTLVSLYHHIRSDGSLGAFNGTWDQFFELIKQNKMPWGNYFEVNADWYKLNKHRENSLILKYEDMKKDHRGHVVKIAKFLGHDLPDKTIDLIVENSTVKTMSKKFVDLQKQDVTWNSDRSNFIRKGQVGDWVNYFSNEQSEYVEAKCKEYFEPLGLSFEYTM